MFSVHIHAPKILFVHYRTAPSIYLFAISLEIGYPYPETIPTKWYWVVCYGYSMLDSTQYSVSWIVIFRNFLHPQQWKNLHTLRNNMWDFQIITERVGGTYERR